MKYLSLLALIFFLACNSETHQDPIVIAEPVRIDSMPAQCPYLTKDEKGNTVLSWVRMINDTSTAFCYVTSTDGNTFGQPIVIPGSNHIEPHSENLPKIIFKPSGEIIALWGTANPNSKNEYSGLVYYVQSFDKGNTWTAPVPLVKDTASYDQRYYDVAMLPDGEAGIIWLDNRKTSPKEGSGLYFARTHGKDGFTGEKLISEPCCQCCRTDLFVDRHGGIHVLYRGIIQDSIRDMVHVMSNDGIESFSAPQRISEDNWVIHGCPHTGPSMTENKNGVHFAWFTGGTRHGCFYKKSADYGHSFTKQDSVSPMGSHPQIVSLPNDELVIAWDESTTVNGKTVKKIGIQTRNPEGLSEAKTYFTNEDSYVSYPVLSPLNDHSFFIAYTTKKGDQYSVMYQLVNLKSS